MLKKTLLSLAVAATTLTIAGCNLSTTDEHDSKIVNQPVGAGNASMPTESGVAPVFDPANSQVPLGIDFLYANTTDGTVNTADKTPPVTTAMNQLAGFSTVAPIYVNVKGGMNPTTLTPDSTVFLLKLKNEVGGSPVDAVDITKLLKAVGALDADNKPVQTKFNDAFADTQPVATTDYTVDQVILTNNGNPLPSIRITPAKPLDPRTKYMVVITNKVKDSGNKSLVPSSTYALARGEQVLPSAALSGVRSLVKLWDGLAKYKLATSGKINLASGDDVVLAYTFTTDDALSTLVSYAAPELFVQKNLPLEKAEDLADKANGQTAGTKIAARLAALRTINQNPNYQPSSFAEYMSADVNGILENVRASATYRSGLYSTLAQTNLQDTFGVNATIRDIANSPAPRTVKIVPSSTMDAVLAGVKQANPDLDIPVNTAPFSLNLGTSTNARFIQGYIELPKFLESATLTELVADTEVLKANATTALRADSRWKASTSVGELLGKALNDGGVYPPKDNNGSTNVTYRFPFPEKIGTHKVPLLVAMPGTDCAASAPFPVIMYVHGITGSRANVLPMASYMAGAGQCVVTVAIDLPEHGVAPKDAVGDDMATMPFNFESSSSLWPVAIANSGGAITGFDGVIERHNGVYGSSVRKAIKYTSGAIEGDSGSTFINMQNFGRTRDNLRQAVVDLLNVNASLANLDAELGGTEGSPKLDLTKVGVVGHSLGGMVASAYVAVNNQASPYNKNLKAIKTLTLANTGSHLTKLLENSPAFAPTIVEGLANADVPVPQGSVSFESFLSVFQANIEAVDPVTSLSKISIPVRTITAPADNTVPNNDYFSDSDNAYLTALQAADKLPQDWKTLSAKAPLAGAQGLPIVNASVTNTNYAAGATHSSFAKPDTAQQIEVATSWGVIVTALKAN